MFKSQNREYSFRSTSVREICCCSRFRRDSFSLVSFWISCLYGLFTSGSLRTGAPIKLRYRGLRRIGAMVSSSPSRPIRDKPMSSACNNSASSQSGGKPNWEPHVKLAPLFLPAMRAFFDGIMGLVGERGIHRGERVMSCGFAMFAGESERENPPNRGDSTAVWSTGGVLERECPPLGSMRGDRTALGSAGGEGDAEPGGDDSRGDVGVLALPMLDGGGVLGARGGATKGVSTGAARALALENRDAEMSSGVSGTSSGTGTRMRGDSGFTAILVFLSIPARYGDCKWPPSFFFCSF